MLECLSPSKNNSWLSLPHTCHSQRPPLPGKVPSPGLPSLLGSHSYVIALLFFPFAKAPCIWDVAMGGHDHVSEREGDRICFCVHQGCWGMGQTWHLLRVRGLRCDRRLGM